MSIRSGQSITKVFTTRKFDTGVATNGDSLPTGTLYVNGTSDAASVTVTNITTGVYKAAVTLPTLAVGDVVDLRIAATVNSVADNGIIWQDVKDIVIDAAGLADANTVKLGPTGSGAAQTARDIGLALPAVAPNADGGLPILSSSGTTLGYTVSALTTYTGNTPQTGDHTANIAAILADTSELQTDWVNGGRLDLILDARSSQTSVDDLPTNAELTTALDVIPTAAALWDLSDGIETSITPRQAMRLILAAAAGKLSGAATTTITIRNVGDSKDRLTATVDADGNRSAVTVDGT